MTMVNQPVHRIRYGAVVAAVWSNNGSAGPFHTTTFRRTFKKSDDTWAESDSFDERDLPALAKAASDAHSWIYTARTNEQASATGGDGSLER